MATFGFSLSQRAIGLGVAAALLLLPLADAFAGPKKRSKSPSVSTRVVKVVPRAKREVRVVAPPRLSFGQIQGLRGTEDPLELTSSVALVLDHDTDEVLFSKNPGAVLPIASITKLMTAVVVMQSKQPLDELLTITAEDVDFGKGRRSRLAVGTMLPRGDLLQLALMASENRAANALGRNFPGGRSAFVAEMNRTAARLGMRDTRYVEPTGLSSMNQSSARDLALLVKAAHTIALIRELSTAPEQFVAVGDRFEHFHNTNRLVGDPAWEIGLQKTGYISEAGRCVVMQARLAGRPLIVVLLDASGSRARLGDAERVRRWLAESALDAGRLLSGSSLN